MILADSTLVICSCSDQSSSSPILSNSNLFIGVASTVRSIRLIRHDTLIPNHLASFNDRKSSFRVSRIDVARGLAVASDAKGTCSVARLYRRKAQAHPPQDHDMKSLMVTKSAPSTLSPDIDHCTTGSCYSTMSPATRVTHHLGRQLGAYLA
jgi:hypothetical protein